MTNENYKPEDHHENEAIGMKLKLKDFKKNIKNRPELHKKDAFETSLYRIKSILNEMKRYTEESESTS